MMEPKYFMGIDPANEDGDRTAVVIMKRVGDDFKIIHTYLLKNTLPPEEERKKIEELVLDISKKYPLKTFKPWWLE